MYKDLYPIQTIISPKWNKSNSPAQLAIKCRYVDEHLYSPILSFGARIESYGVLKISQINTKLSQRSEANPTPIIPLMPRQIRQQTSVKEHMIMLVAIYASRIQASYR
ncbi:hypothetical protein ACJMK2_037284 [Sinanodonta woodiana]|uniref:Uncharacterized protein n=1 Tax=Sinanodonta woodiana TaxID=1069815 RepID=A0ABD3WLN8_SINWO